MALNIDAAELLKKYLQEETIKQKSIEKEKKIWKNIGKNKLPYQKKLRT